RLGPRENFTTLWRKPLQWLRRLTFSDGSTIVVMSPHSNENRCSKSMTMDYINLGSTGLKVSRLCLGTMTYGSKRWRQWVLEEEESRPFLRRALEFGINFFDTADMYSVGVSEEI